MGFLLSIIFKVYNRIDDFMFKHLSERSYDKFSDFINIDKRVTSVYEYYLQRSSESISTYKIELDYSNSGHYTRFAIDVAYDAIMYAEDFDEMVGDLAKLKFELDMIDLYK